MPHGGFIEVYRKVSLETCKLRDVKALYKLAMTGEIKNYIGIDSHHEPPLKPEIIIDTEKLNIDESVEKVLQTIGERRIIYNNNF